MRISENDITRVAPFASGPKARLSEAISGSQFERPSSAITSEMRGFSSATSATSIRPVSSGKKRSLVVSRSAASGGVPRSLIAQRHVREADLAVGKQRDRNVAAQDRIEPGDGADFRLDRLAHLIGRDQHRHDAENAEDREQEGGDGKAQALEAGDSGQGGIFRVFEAVEGRLYRPGDCWRNLGQAL